MFRFENWAGSLSTSTLMLLQLSTAWGWLQMTLVMKVAAVLPAAWDCPVMIWRADSCVTVSRTWLAKNIRPVSMIANSSAKKTGATSANSTAADPLRLRRNRRNIFAVEAVRATGDDIEKTRTGGGWSVIEQ